MNHAQAILIGVTLGILVTPLLCLAIDWAIGLLAGRWRRWRLARLTEEWRVEHKDTVLLAKITLEHLKQGTDNTRDLRALVDSWGTQIERQGYCGTCGKWRWPDECEHSKLIAKEFRAMVASVRRMNARKYPSSEVQYRKDMRAIGRLGREATQ